MPNGFRRSPTVRINLAPIYLPQRLLGPMVAPSGYGARAVISITGLGTATDHPSRQTHVAGVVPCVAVR